MGGRDETPGFVQRLRANKPPVAPSVFGAKRNRKSIVGGGPNYALMIGSATDALKIAPITTAIGNRCASLRVFPIAQEAPPIYLEHMPR